MFPFYPCYNVVKRFLKKSETIVASSLANNGLEWAAGALLGNLLGVTLVLWKDYKSLKALELGAEDPQARLTSSGVRRFSLSLPPPSKVVDFAISVTHKLPRPFITFLHTVPWIAACALQLVCFAMVYLYTSYWEGSTTNDMLALAAMWIIALWGVMHFTRVFVSSVEPKDDDWRRVGKHEEGSEGGHEL